MNDTNLDRVFQLSQKSDSNTKSERFFTLFTFVLQGVLALNNLRTIALLQNWLEGGPVPQAESLVPYDTMLLNLFLVVHLTRTSYIGRCSLDRLQYLLLRVLPLFGAFLSMSLSPLSPDLKLCGSVLTLLAAAHFFGADWDRAFRTPFSEVV